MKNFRYLLLFLFLTSCGTRDSDTLIGNWTIDKIEDNGQNLMYTLTSNLISFEKNHSCFGPGQGLNSNHVGKWHLIRKGDIQYIDIKISGNVLNGRYEVKFQNDSVRKLLNMVLFTNRKRIICSKSLHSYKE
jgi:hypothetical protein